MIGTLIGLATGALGGNLAGAVMKKFSMGTLWNSVVGILGGGLGASVVGMLTGGAVSAANSGAMDPSSLISSVLGGTVGGGGLMAIIGLIKGAMNK